MILDSVKELERLYSRKIVEPDGHQLSISTRGCNDGIYDWFPMVQRFTRGFLYEIFKNEELKNRQVIFDPFMGSGNTLVACQEFGKVGYGVDVSPLFWFIAHVKTSEYSDSDFDRAIEATDQIKEAKEEKVEIPEFSSFRRLFNPRRLRKLLTLKKIAYNLNPKARELLLFALVSELVRFSKATRYGKGLRIEQAKKSLSVNKVLRFKLRKMQEDYEIHSKNKVIRHRRQLPLLGNARNLADANTPFSSSRNGRLPKGKIDCVITSPPYCNSADYIEMYKLEHWFIDCVKSYQEFRNLSYATIRSHTTCNNESVEWEHQVVEDICDALEVSNLLWNKKIPMMIRAYFDDLHACLRELKHVLRPGGVVFLLVANSSYATTPIPTDLLLADASESLGFDVERIKKVRLLTTSGQQWSIMDSQSKKLLRESVLVLRV